MFLTSKVQDIYCLPLPSHKEKQEVLNMSNLLKSIPRHFQIAQTKYRELLKKQNLQRTDYLCPMNSYLI